MIAPTLEVLATGTVGRWTAEEGRWYVVLRKNKRSLTIASGAGIVTLPREQVLDLR